MEGALILGAALMGLTGAPHCAAMCGAPCAAVLRRCGGSTARVGPIAGFSMGRLLSYAAGGAIVAASVGAVSWLGAAAPALRPLWTLLQLAVLGLGLWLLLTGRQPAWWTRLGSAPAAPLAPVPVPAGWQRMASPLRAGAAGSLWLAVPCGLLQSALLVAALANTPWQGAAAMAAFAATSSLGLWLPERLWSRAASSSQVVPWAARAAGVMLVASASWALSHELWMRWAAWCQTA